MPTAPGRTTVLLVEDEEGVRSFAALVLGTAGFDVIEAEDGPKAVELAAAHAGPIPLVISDLQLPSGMAGAEVAAGVRATLPEARALYVSGQAGEGVAGEFLAKPFSPASLTARVREVLAG